VADAEELLKGHRRPDRGADRCGAGQGGGIAEAARPLDEQEAALMAKNQGGR